MLGADAGATAGEQLLCCGASSSVCCGLCWLMVGIAVMQLLALLLSGSAGSGAHFLGGLLSHVLILPLLLGPTDVDIAAGLLG